MKRIPGIGAIVIAFVASTFAAAQLRGPTYQLKDEVVVSGIVSSITTKPDWMGNDGLNIALRSTDALRPRIDHVDVATTSFFQRIGFGIAVGDDLTLRGCWSQSANGEVVFLVHALVKDNVTINVRDSHGVPIW